MRITTRRAAVWEAGLAESDVTISPIGYAAGCYRIGSGCAVVLHQQAIPFSAWLVWRFLEIPLDPSHTPLVGASIITIAKWAQAHRAGARAGAMNGRGRPQIAIDATSPGMTRWQRDSLASASAVARGDWPVAGRSRDRHAGTC